MTKDDIADALEEIGTLLELKGENSFRTNAYHNGARAVRQLDGDLSELVQQGRLEEARGIGDALRDKITTLVTTGRLPYLEDLRRQVPVGMVEMLRLPGVGAKKAIALHDQLGIDSIDRLKAACEAGEVAKLKGFGEKTQQRILDGITFLGQIGKRVRIDLALPLGETLLVRVRTFPGVLRSELCGSLRRRRETVADIDMLVSSPDAAPIMEAFVKLPEVVQVLGQGPTKSSILATMHVEGEKVTMQADLRVVTDEEFPFALHYFTGSKAHNIRMRQRAIDRGWSLNEYSLGDDDQLIPCTTEAEIFAALGLEYIPPELREDTGEIESAEANKLPALVMNEDIRGVFHNHSTYSDGGATIEEMALAAKALGFEYFGIGDHSQSLTVARGMPPGIVRKQWAEIDALNKKLKGIRILKGIESDILADGSLDFARDTLDALEIVIASVHNRHKLDEDAMTERLVTAMRQPIFKIWGHALGRLVLRREPFACRFDDVLDAIVESPAAIEINGDPHRLDLDPARVRKAHARGIRFVLSSDAHSTSDLDYLENAVAMARRARLRPADVINTLPPDEFLAAVRPAR